MSRFDSRTLYFLSGLAGVLASLFLTLLLFALTPHLSALALLSAERLGTNAAALVYLLALGLIVVAELPMGLFLLVRMVRRALPAWTVNLFHGSYTFFPAVYGALGTLLTGERWWLWVMLLVTVMRVATSFFVVDPRRATRPTPPSGKAGPAPPSPAVAPSGQVLGSIRGFILDMDGVLYRGNTVRDGAIEFISYLNENEIPYICLTNNASRTSEMYQEKLDRLGIPIDSRHVLGAAQATAEWLAREAAPGARVLPIGEMGLREELSRIGFSLVEGAPADYVVVGIDFGITYERLKQAALAIRQNARFIGTNPDSTFPSEEGLVPGNGATLAYLETATGVAPTIIGKPSAAIMEVARTHLDLPPEQVAMVGDRLNTDIEGGHNAGLTTILLRGGVTSDAELAVSPLQPDFVFDDLGKLLAAYRATRPAAERAAVPLTP